MNKELKENIVKAIDDLIAERNSFRDEKVGLEKTIVLQDTVIAEQSGQYTTMRAALRNGLKDYEKTLKTCVTQHRAPYEEFGKWIESILCGVEESEVE